MSRNALSLTSEILGLKVLVSDAVNALTHEEEFPRARRMSLARTFHRYIQNNSLEHLRPNAISKLSGSVRPMAFHIVRDEAANDAQKLLKVVDKFRNKPLDRKEKQTLLKFLTRVDAALERSRASIPTTRYL
jgi:hypothetical protein